MKNQITLLEQEQYFEDSQELDIIKQYGTTAAITDFSILLGGIVSNSNYSSDSNNLEDRTGCYWTISADNEGCVRAVGYDGTRVTYHAVVRHIAVRPALPFSSISNASKGARGTSGVYEIQYGEYPQQAVDRNFATTLESEYQARRMQNTGKTYTTDSRIYDDYNSGFQAQQHQEYEYSGKRYIRVTANMIYDSQTLSNGVSVKHGDAVWVEVQPITWQINQRTNIALAKKCLVAGVRFHKGRWDGNFNNTEINTFLQTHFARDIVSNRTYAPVNQQDDIDNAVVHEKTKFLNPYGFDFKGVTEEDIIKGAVESGVGVFLHGASSEGKSARVKQLDPDLEIIYLRNASPDSLNGKSVVSTDSELTPEMVQRQKLVDELVAKVDSGQISLEEYTTELSKLPRRTPEMFDIPPTWYKKIKVKCEAEPNKIHIVFFDEITNALPSIQGMAYNIVLDREVNGIWKLPPNARIVAAGNEMKDSLAANNLAEPLFNRFAHVYIHTTVESWLEWATTPEEEYQRLDYTEPKAEMKIHPAVISYIAFKREQGLRTEYTGVKPNADPRKWELASKMLYRTKTPEMLRSLIGDDLTIDFVSFCNQQVITLDNVINGEYDNSIFDMNISQRWATTSGLLAVKETDILKVSEFVDKLGSEYSSMFYRLWSGSNPKRKELVADVIAEVDDMKKGGMRK